MNEGHGTLDWVHSNQFLRTETNANLGFIFLTIFHSGVGVVDVGISDKRITSPLLVGSVDDDAVLFELDIKMSLITVFDLGV